MSHDYNYHLPEYEAVRQCTGTLVTTVQHCISLVASDCLARGLISEDVEAYIHTNNPDSEKSSRLIACVCESIRNERANFSAFVEVLKADRYLEGALNELLETYSKCF